jgi:predicted secreted protein
MGGHGPILIGEDPVTAEAPAGEDIVVEADENPTAGYRWQLAIEPAGAAEVLDDSFAASGDTPGAGGRRRWTVRVHAGPRIQLTASLRRPWERDAKAERTATATLIVR